MFAASDMTMAVQTADFAVYCIDWGMSEPILRENADEFSPWLS